MYMELTPEDTQAILQQLLLSALYKFEFPKQNLDYQEKDLEGYNEDGDPMTELGFINKLTREEINIIRSTISIC